MISLQSNVDAIINTPAEQDCINTPVARVTSARLCTLSTCWGEKKTSWEIVASSDWPKCGCTSMTCLGNCKGQTPIKMQTHDLWMSFCGTLLASPSAADALLCVCGENTALADFLIAEKGPQLFQWGGKFSKCSSKCFSVAWKDTFPPLPLSCESLFWWVFQGKHFWVP